MHLLLDGVSDGRLFRHGGIGLVHRWLDRTVEALAVTPLERMVLRRAESLHAFLIIAESHLSLEALETGEVWVDIFSCKEFKETVALRLAVGILGLERHRMRVFRDRLSGLLKEEARA